MKTNETIAALVTGAFIFFGLSTLGYLLGNAVNTFQQYERSVNVKGLSEREYEADVVIWPIPFTVADNTLAGIYATIEQNTARIQAFLVKNGIAQADISVEPPSITDRKAQLYGNENNNEFRYTAAQTVTVYSKNISVVRALMGRLSELGKEGIAFTGESYQSQPEFIFTRLNEVKPDMIEEATKNAREVAEKFAADSQSQLGKIKRASQGQFSIVSRDKNNPQIKKVRVVSTIEYYLSD